LIMSKSKRCPSCQKAIPSLAVRCQYCGFKLSKAADKLPSMVRVSTPPPPRSSKKTMILGASVPPPPKPRGLGEPGGKKNKIPGPTKPLPQLAKSLPPPPPPSKRAEAKDNLDWISQDQEDDFLEDSQLILLDEDSGLLENLDPADNNQPTHQADDDYANLVEEAKQASSHIPPAEKSTENTVKTDNQSAFIKALKQFLFRDLVSDSSLDSAESKKIPLPLVKFMSKLQRLHAIIAGVAILVLIVFIATLNEPTKLDKPTKVLSVNTSAKQDTILPKKSTSLPDKQNVAKVPEKVPEKTKPVDVAKTADPISPDQAPLDVEEKQIPTPARDCMALANYPEFPLRDILNNAVKAGGSDAVCGLFGTSSSSVASAYVDLPMVGPSGNDWIPGGSFLEIFANGEADRAGPIMEFLFANDKLYEIKLLYGQSNGENLNEKDFADVFDEKPEKLRDYAGRRIIRFLDGQMQVELIESRQNGKTLRTLLFRSKSISEAIASDISASKKHESLLARSESLYTRWLFKASVTKLDELIKTAPGLGIAYSKKALSLTRLEEFDLAYEAANKALKISTDTRTQAKAYEIMAMTALYNNDKSKAIAYLGKAAAADPADKSLLISKKELETGEYTTKRVALVAAKMVCLHKRKSKSTPKGILATGNFPTMQLYFDILRKAKRDPQFDNLQRQYVKLVCR